MRRLPNEVWCRATLMHRPCPTHPERPDLARARRKAGLGPCHVSPLRTRRRRSVIWHGLDTSRRRCRQEERDGHDRIARRRVDGAVVLRRARRGVLRDPPLQRAAPGSAPGALDHDLLALLVGLRRLRRRHARPVHRPRRRHRRDRPAHPHAADRRQPGAGRRARPARPAALGPAAHLAAAALSRARQDRRQRQALVPGRGQHPVGGARAEPLPARLRVRTGARGAGPGARRAALPGRRRSLAARAGRLDQAPLGAQRRPLRPRAALGGLARLRPLRRSAPDRPARDPRADRQAGRVPRCARPWTSSTAAAIRGWWRIRARSSTRSCRRCRIRSATSSAAACSTARATTPGAAMPWPSSASPACRRRAGR